MFMCFTKWSLVKNSNYSAQLFSFIMILEIMTLGIQILSIIILWVISQLNATQDNNTQHKNYHGNKTQQYVFDDTQYNDPLHNDSLGNNIWHNDNRITLCIIILRTTYTQLNNTYHQRPVSYFLRQCRYDKCQYKECRGANTEGTKPSIRVDILLSRFDKWNCLSRANRISNVWF
jgi:hypothetical protein